MLLGRLIRTFRRRRVTRMWLALDDLAGAPAGLGPTLWPDPRASTPFASDPDRKI